MNLVGYSRLVSAPFHIFLTSSSEIKLIDTARVLKKKTIYPSLIIKSLDELGYKNLFFNFVKDNRPDLYAKWS